MLYQTQHFNKTKESECGNILVVIKHGNKSLKRQENKKESWEKMFFYKQGFWITSQYPVGIYIKTLPKSSVSILPYL